MAKKLSSLMTVLIAVILAVSLLPVGVVQAAGNDNDVEWDGTGHIPGDAICDLPAYSYRSPVSPYTNQSVTIRARSYPIDLTGIRLYYTTNPNASVFDCV